jgi:hypothetical protein
MAQIDTLTNVGAVVSTDLALILRGGANVLGTLGSMVGQNSTAVTITGGTINGTTIGATTPASVAATTGTFSSTLASGGITTTGNTAANAATAGEGKYFPNNAYGAFVYGQGTTYDVALGQRTTGVALGVLAGTTNVVIPTGNVGIGTSSVGAKLHLKDTTGSAVKLLELETAWSSPSGNKSIEWTDATNTLGRISVDYTSPKASMRFGSLYNSGYQTGDVMTLTADGNVGIGTSSPAYKTVISANGASGIEFGPAYSGTSNLVQHYSRSGGVYVDVVNEAAQHKFNIAGTTKMTLDASGKLLINSATANAQLAVKAPSGIRAMSLQVAADGNAAIAFANAAGTDVGYIQTDAAGIGIYLGGGAAANLLDDYEEGTWTPTITNSTGSYTTQVGRYTKIGNLVYVNCNVNTAFTNTGTTSQDIGGLPFTSENVSFLFSVGTVFPVVGFNQGNSDIAAQVTINTTSVALYTVAPATGINYTTIVSNTFGTTVEFEFSLCYRAA